MVGGIFPIVGVRNSGMGVQQKQKVSIAHMGRTDENKVLVVFETSDFDTFMEIFTSQSTIDAMSNDGIVEGTVEVFILNDSYRP